MARVYVGTYRASPCVPGAAILDTLDGSECGYDVPADWRWKED